MRARLPDTIHIAFFVSFVGVFFYQLFLGKLPVPSDALVGLYHPWRDLYAKQYPRGVPFKNFLITDPVRQQIPWRKIVMDEWKQGRIPRWNPFTFSGTPLAANIQAAAFYPFNVLFFLFSFPVAWTVLVGLQPLLAGIFLYFYLRHLRLHPLACLLGAIAWSFSGFSVAWLTWGTMLQSAMWLPLILLSLENVSSGRRKWWMALSAAILMTVFAGHAQIALYILVFAFVYWRVRMYPVSKTQSNSDVGRAVVVSWIISSVAWLPFIKLFVQSARTQEPVWMNPGFFVPWEHLIQFIAPDFFGNPATLNYWGTWNYGEFVGYIGIVPLVFAGIALGSRFKFAGFWMWAILVSLVFALPTPIAKIIYWLNIPALSSLQPTRLMVIIDFCLAVLSAIGLDAFIKKPLRVGPVFTAIGVIIAIAWGITLPGGDHLFVARRNLFLPTVLFAATGAIVYAAKRFSKLRQVLLVLLIVLASFDLLRFGWKFTPFTPKEYFFPDTSITRFLQSQPKPFRVMSLDERILPPNVSSYYGIETVEGYDPIYSARYETFFAGLARGTANVSPPYGFNRILTAKNIDSPFLPNFNVRYVLSLEDIDRSFLTKVMQEGETRLYEYTKALPRAQLVEEISMVPSGRVSDVFEKLAQLGDGAALVHTPIDLLSIPLAAGEGVSIESYTSDRIQLLVTAVNPRLLIIRNPFDPGWKATLDGVRASVIPVDYELLGVVVAGGSHRVVLTYR